MIVYKRVHSLLSFCTNVRICIYFFEKIMLTRQHQLEQTIARKWGWNDDVTKEGADEVINSTASEGVEENDDCHGQIALQADFAFAAAAGQ